MSYQELPSKRRKFSREEIDNLSSLDKRDLIVAARKAGLLTDNDIVNFFTMMNDRAGLRF